MRHRELLDAAKLLMDHETKFYTQAARSLAGCQLVEQALKLYITEAFLLVKKCIGSQMPFGMSGEDYQDSSLERLLSIFDKLSDNVALKKALAAFKGDRNFLSHRAIASCIDPGGELDYGEMAKLSGTLTRIAAEAKRLEIAIHEEGNKIRAYLDFDDLDLTGADTKSR